MAKSKYNPETFPLLAEGWARDGLIDVDIAANLGISEDTFYRYIKKHPEFSEAITRGKAPIDRKVENSLLKLAGGYSYEEKKTVMKNVKVGKDAEGKDVYKAMKIEETITTRHVPPNQRSIEFWLKNRKPDMWRDRQELDHTTKGESIQPTIIQLGTGAPPTDDPRYSNETNR